MQMPMADCRFKRLLQPRLNNMDMAALQRFYCFFIYVEAANLKTGLRQCDRGGQADIAQPHDSNFHNFLTSFRKIFLHYTTFSADFNVVFEFSPQSVYNDKYPAIHTVLIG